jgi:predicted acetyltransferase
MNPSVFPLSLSRRDEALDVADRAFDNTPRDYFERHQSADPEWDVAQSLVVEDGGTIVGQLWIANRAMHYGVARVPFGGIADVAVDPAHRNRGHAGRLLDAAVERMRNDGQPLSLLSTRSPAVYASRGWHPISTALVEGTFPSGDIEWAGGYVVRPYQSGDLPAVSAIYNDIAADRVGPLERGEAYWSALMDWLPSLSPESEVHFDVLVQVRTVVAYAITQLSDDALEILDGGIQYENLAIPLLDVWRDRAAARGVSRLTGELHPASELFDLLRKRADAAITPTDHYKVRLNSLHGALESVVPELIRRRRRMAPLPGPTFVLDVDGEAARVETPMANVVIGEPAGSEPVVELTSGQFLDLYLGAPGGYEALDALDIPPHVDVYLRRLFPNSPFMYWNADRF